MIIIESADMDSSSFDRDEKIGLSIYYKK